MTPLYPSPVVGEGEGGAPTKMRNNDILSLCYASLNAKWILNMVLMNEENHPFSFRN